MRLNQNVNRIAVSAYGCAGGVTGFSKANILAIAIPDAVVLLFATQNAGIKYDFIYE